MKRIRTVAVFASTAALVAGVAANLLGSAAETGKVQTFDHGINLGQESLLHLAGNLDFTIDALALCRFLREVMDQSAVLNGQAGLQRHRGKQAPVGAGIWLFAQLGPQSHHPNQAGAARQGQQKLGVELDGLDEDLTNLQVLYEKYFLGIDRMPPDLPRPWETPAVSRIPMINPAA